MAMGELKELLAQAPSEETWEAICDFLDGIEDDEVLVEAVALCDERLKEWPDGLRVGRAQWSHEKSKHKILTICRVTILFDIVQNIDSISEDFLYFKIQTIAILQNAQNVLVGGSGLTTSYVLRINLIQHSCELIWKYEWDGKEEANISVTGLEVLNSENDCIFHTSREEYKETIESRLVCIRGGRPIIVDTTSCPHELPATTGTQYIYHLSREKGELTYWQIGQKGLKRLCLQSLCILAEVPVSRPHAICQYGTDGLLITYNRYAYESLDSNTLLPKETISMSHDFGFPASEICYHSKSKMLCTIHHYLEAYTEFETSGIAPWGAVCFWEKGQQSSFSIEKYYPFIMDNYDMAPSADINQISQQESTMNVCVVQNLPLVDVGLPFDGVMLNLTTSENGTISTTIKSMRAFGLERACLCKNAFPKWIILGIGAKIVEVNFRS